MLQRIAHFLGQQFKLLLLLMLAASFVFWGVADMVMQQPGSQEVARAGSETISDGDFRSMYERTREQYRRSPMAKGMTDENLIQMGLPRQVLDGLINDRLLALEAKEQGLVVSEKAIAEITRKNPAFAGESGSFDRKRFEQVIHAMGMTEKGYVSAMRANEASQQLGFALFGQKLLHPTLFQAMHLLRKETRDARVWVFTQSLKPAAATPTEAQLRDYYKNHPSEFQAPEYRAIGLVYFDPKKMDGNVSEAALRAAYEEQKANLTVPESRQVDQLLFAKEEDAKAVHARLQGGEPWEKAAADAAVVNKGATDLGAVTRAKSLPGLKDAIFALKESEVSAPVKSTFGWHVLRLRGITPESVPSFETAHAGLAKTLGQQQAEDALYRQIDQLESALSSGADFENAAKAADAAMVRVGPLDINGVKPNGQSQLGLPKLADFLSRVFALKEQETTSALALPDGRQLVAGLLSVTPSKPRGFEEVRAQVAAAWDRENRAAAIQQMADAIAALPSGAEEKAKSSGAFAVLVEGVKRGQQASLRDPAKNTVPLPDEMIEALFTLREGQHTKSFVLPTGDVAFATLETVHSVPEQLKAAPDAMGELDKSREALSGEVGADAYKLYLQYLRAKHKVTVNEARLSSILKPQTEAE